MSLSRAKTLTGYLRRVDRRLSAKYRGEGMIHVLFSDALVNKLVFALTDNWSVNGNPVPWGVEPILLRLRQIDASVNQDMFNEMRKTREKMQASKDRDFKRNIEDGIREQRSQFANAFKDINTSTLDKKYDKRRIKGA